MTFNRRSFLRFGAISTASVALSGRFKAWGAQSSSSQSILSFPFATHTYEEGVDGQLVPIALGVVSVSGRPFYSSVNAVHEIMGWVSLGARAGGRLSYANSSTGGSSGSVYVTPGKFDPGATIAVVSFSPAVGDPTSLVKVRLREEGRVDVVDGVNRRLSLSQARWKPGDRIRVDWQQSWDGSQITLTVWLYIGTNVEGWRPNAVLTGTVPSVEPGVVTLGQDKNKTASVGFDTYREYDVAGLPAPFNPLIGAILLHSYDEGVAGQVIRLRDAGAGQVLVVGGSPSYSAEAAMHGPVGVLVPAAEGGGTLGYDNPYPPANTGSVYLRTLTRGETSAQVVAVKNGVTPLAMLMISPLGNLSVADGAGTTLAETTIPAVLDTWTRVDWQTLWDGATLVVTARYFAEFADGVDAFQEITGSVPGPVTPDTWELGSTSGTWAMHLDTFRTFGDATVWPGPYQEEIPEPAVQYSMPGLGLTAAATEAGISSAVLNAATMDFGWSTSIDDSENLIGDITYVGSNVVDADGSVHHSISGLTPGTTYYGLLATAPGLFLGDLVRFTTLPGPGVPFTVKVAVGSCQQNQGDASSTAWDDVHAYDPHLLVSIGDYGYWGGNFSQSEPYDPYTMHMEKYAQQTQGIPSMKLVRQRTVTLEMADDHEYSGNNEDSFNSVVRENSMIAMRKVFALHPLADVSEPKRGLWGAFNLGDNIRVVMLDCISMDRSPGAALDPPETGVKTFLGAAQLAWWMTEMQRPEILKIVIGGKALLGDYPTSRDPETGLLRKGDWDKFWGCPTERTIMMDFIANNTTSTGGAINVDWIGGDRHANGYCSAETNPLGDFPVILSSGWDHHALGQNAGESYDLAYGFGIAHQHNQQYVQMEITDDGAGTITRTVRSREVHTEGGPMEAGWAGAADVTDTWT